MPRIAIVTTHPIQYNAPLFAKLASEPGLELMVFYTWSQSKAGSLYDPDFKINIKWDIPLLEGYPFRFVENLAERPGSDHFKGIYNPTLIDEISEWNPDVIVIYGWAFRSHLACLRYFSGKVPVLFRGDSTLLDETPGLKKWLRRIFLTWVYRHVDIGLFAGRNNQAYYLKHGMRPAQLYSAPHAIDNDRFTADDSLRTAAARSRRRALGIADGDVVLLFVGKLESKKDPGFLIRLISVPGASDFHVVFVGNGHLEKELKSEYAGNDRVHFLGFQNQQVMPEIYRMADLLVLPSRWNETWGLAVNEAMACGRPVLVSDRVGCAPDLVEQGVTGWTFPRDRVDIHEIYGWIRRAADNPDTLHNMGQKALCKIQDYSMERLIEGIHQAIGSININEKKKGKPA